MSVEADVDYWKSVALYLADCHAGTAERAAELKSTGKHELERQRKMVTISRDLLLKARSPHLYSVASEERIIERLNTIRQILEAK